MSNKGIVFLDFKGKIVYYAEHRKIWHDEPATAAESNAFMAHFYNKGQKTCTFRELKQFVTFHGTRKEGRVYVTVNITNPNLYMDLLRLDNPNMQETIAEYVYKAKYQKSESEVKRKANIAAKHAIKAFMKAIDQKIEEVYKTY